MNKTFNDILEQMLGAYEANPEKGATAKETVSISASCKKQIDDMRKIFEESSFKDATTGEMTKKK